MVNLTKQNVALAALAVGVPVMFFFQNCSQSSPAAATASDRALGAVSTADTLVVLPSSDANDINLNLPSTDDEDNVTSDKGSIARCDQLVISDVLLKFVSISSQKDNPNAVSLEIIDPDKSVSLEKLTLQVKATQTERVRDLTLILRAKGNKILTADNIVIDMQSPMNQQAAVKVSLVNEYTITAGQVYNLVLKINPHELIASTNKNNCLFKPLIQAADLASLQK